MKKVHDFVAKTLLFWGTGGVQMARGALFGVFVCCREVLVTTLRGRTIRGNTDDARERSKTVAG